MIAGIGKDFLVHGRPQQLGISNIPLSVYVVAIDGFYCHDIEERTAIIIVVSILREEVPLYRHVIVSSLSSSSVGGAPS